MRKAVVLGIGNLLMCDDGIGVRVTEALAQGKSPGNIRFAAGETDLDYCLDVLQDCDIYVIIDCACSGKEPCSVDVTDLKQVFAQTRPALAFHDFDLLQAMKREGLRKEGMLITVEAGSVGFSTELSPLMQERFEEIVRKIRGIIASYLSAVCNIAELPGRSAAGIFTDRTG